MVKKATAGDFFGFGVEDASRPGKTKGALDSLSAGLDPITQAIRDHVIIKQNAAILEQIYKQLSKEEKDTTLQPVDGLAARLAALRDTAPEEQGLAAHLEEVTKIRNSSPEAIAKYLQDDNNKELANAALNDQNLQKTLHEIEVAGYAAVHQEFSKEDLPNSFKNVEWKDQENSRTTTIMRDNEPVCNLTQNIIQGGNNAPDGINQYRQIEFATHLELGKQGPLHLSMALQDADGNNMPKNGAVYFTAHYDESGKLTEVSTPKPIKFAGTGMDAIGYIEIDGKKYTLPVTQGNYNSMMTEVAVNKGLGANLSQDISRSADSISVGPDKSAGQQPSGPTPPPSEAGAAPVVGPTPSGNNVDLADKFKQQLDSVLELEKKKIKAQEGLSNAIALKSATPFVSKDGLKKAQNLNKEAANKLHQAKQELSDLKKQLDNDQLKSIYGLVSDGAKNETKKRLGFTVSAPGDNTAKLKILNDALISPKLKEIAILKNDIKINEAKLSDIYTRKSLLSLNSAEQDFEKKLKKNVIKYNSELTKKASEFQAYREGLGISVSKSELNQLTAQVNKEVKKEFEAAKSAAATAKRAAVAAKKETKEKEKAAAIAEKSGKKQAAAQANRVAAEAKKTEKLEANKVKAAEKRALADKQAAAKKAKVNAKWAEKEAEKKVEKFFNKYKTDLQTISNEYKTELKRDGVDKDSKEESIQRMRAVQVLLSAELSALLDEANKEKEAKKNTSDKITIAQLDGYIKGLEEWSKKLPDDLKKQTKEVNILFDKAEKKAAADAKKTLAAQKNADRKEAAAAAKTAAAEANKVKAAKAKSQKDVQKMFDKQYKSEFDEISKQLKASLKNAGTDLGKITQSKQDAETKINGLEARLRELVNEGKTSAQHSKYHEEGKTSIRKAQLDGTIAGWDSFGAKLEAALKEQRDQAKKLFDKAEKKAAAQTPPPPYTGPAPKQAGAEPTPPPPYTGPAAEVNSAGVVPPPLPPRPAPNPPEAAPTPQPEASASETNLTPEQQESAAKAEKLAAEAAAEQTTSQEPAAPTQPEAATPQTQDEAAFAEATNSDTERFMKEYEAMMGRTRGDPESFYANNATELLQAAFTDFDESDAEQQRIQEQADAEQQRIQEQADAEQQQSNGYDSEEDREETLDNKISPEEEKETENYQNNLNAAQSQSEEMEKQLEQLNYDEGPASEENLEQNLEEPSKDGGISENYASQFAREEPDTEVGVKPTTKEELENLATPEEGTSPVGNGQGSPTSTLDVNKVNGTDVEEQGATTEVDWTTAGVMDADQVIERYHNKKALEVVENAYKNIDRELLDAFSDDDPDEGAKVAARAVRENLQASPSSGQGTSTHARSNSTGLSKTDKNRDGGRYS